MRDQLIGHVLGALEAHEHEEVEKLLRTDHQLCQELELIRKSLVPLECDKDQHEPPFGLAASTCKRVAAIRVGRVHPADRRVAVATDGRPRGMLFGWSLVDVAVAAGILVAAGLLFFPAMQHSRFNAQVANCQNNLRTIGSALADHSKSSPQGMYPAIPVSQKFATNGMTPKMAAAGMYAPQLIESGYIARKDKDKVFRCSSDGCSRGEDSTVPTMADLQQASDDELPALLRRAGGSYGYTLGYHDYRDAHGEYHPTVARGRANFPIMADSPCPKLGFSQSSNHGGYGQNVLYDDGHVRYMTTCRHSEKGADPDFFHNDKGRIAAGEHDNDAVIGSSSAKPE